MKALSHKKIEMKWYEPVTIAVGFGLFIWFCIPFFFGIFNVGSYFGIAVSILAMAYFPVKRFCKRKMAQKPYFVTFSIVNFLAVIFGIWIAFLTGLMIFAINQVPLANVTAVVLGSPLEENELGPSLTARLDRAVEYLEQGKVVIFGSGTGNPYFTTDTAAALRAAEINADAILVGKTIDGVYSDDPKINSAAIKYDNITYQDILNKDLKVMDLTAISLCKENNIPLVVFALQEPENIIKAIKGEKIGTLVN